MRLPIHTPDSAPAESRPIMEGIAADLGLVPNLAATAATLHGPARWFRRTATGGGHDQA
jgi:hypothetical protein